jgi:glycerate 2-kinase
MIDRATCEAAFLAAVVACDPAVRVRAALQRQALGDRVVGLAIGKAALAMARGAGSVTRGLVITNALDASPVPPGWSAIVSSHPHVTSASVQAGLRALALVESVAPDDVLLALISGGASALVEVPRVGLEEYNERVRAAMHSGMSIHELNRLRKTLSTIKGGGLAARSLAPVVTLIVSDVIGDDPQLIGSAPTVSDPPRADDYVEVVAPMASFGQEVEHALLARGVAATRIAEPISDDVTNVADQLARTRDAAVAWGEPTVRVPEGGGRGGRAQQLALLLAQRLRGTRTSAFVAGSDGIDGPSSREAAGAYVDGMTWDAIVKRGIDPALALARCDAGTALDAVGALVVTGPTGINHADVVILG